MKLTLTISECVSFIMDGLEREGYKMKSDYAHFKFEEEDEFVTVELEDVFIEDEETPNATNQA